jgi:transitional endoplasmic reticulum ATPase
MSEIQNTAEKTQNQVMQEKLLATLAELGGLRVQDDALTFEGSKFILPAALAGRVGDAIAYLKDWERSQEAEFEFNRTFPYRPYDGAAAFDRAMKKVFGTAGIGGTIQTMFGDIKPEYVTVEVGHGQTIQVPWNRVNFAPLNASFYLMGKKTHDKGPCFYLAVEAPKKYRRHIEAFFQVVEAELRTGSIYKGKAITAAVDPGFLNTATVDPKRVIYSDDVMAQLDAHIWSAVKYTDAMRTNGLPLKRQVLLYGPYGTGKTLAGLLTAQQCEANGWTYIQVRSGEDDLYTALKTAEMYAPAVVMFEDIDQIRDAHSTTAGVARLLDVLDGVSNKGSEVMAVFTTNHADRLHRGMMRPGRLDAVIELAGLDAAGIRRLVEAHVPADLLAVAEGEWDIVTAAFDGLLPAFAKEAVDRAKRYGIARTGGHATTITAEDLRHAANGIRTQERMMADAPLASDKDSLSVAFSRVLQNHNLEWDGDLLPIKPVEASKQN